jgi:hypothetical protein
MGFFPLRLFPPPPPPPDLGGFDALDEDATGAGLSLFFSFFGFLSTGFDLSAAMLPFIFSIWLSIIAMVPKSAAVSTVKLWSK